MSPAKQSTRKTKTRAGSAPAKSESLSFEKLQRDAFLPLGQMIYTEPFKLPGMEDSGYYVLVDHGVDNKHNFALYGYSMGGPGGIPLIVMRGMGDWYVYGSKSKENPQGRSAKDTAYGNFVELLESKAESILKDLIYESKKTK
ncbi:MAG: hypothetical protein ACHQ03_11635 [Candidatus Bathyarchaeia archaeon]